MNDENRTDDGFVEVDLDWTGIDAWLPDKEPTVEGVVTGGRWTVVYGGHTGPRVVGILKLANDDGGRLVWESAGLKGHLEKLRRGDVVRIQYLGMASLGKGRQMRRFAMQVKPHPNRGKYTTLFGEKPDLKQQPVQRELPLRGGSASAVSRTPEPEFDDDIPF